MCKDPEAGNTKCFLETERKKAGLEQLNKRDVGSIDVGRAKKIYFLKNQPRCYVPYTVICQEKEPRN